MKDPAALLRTIEACLVYYEDENDAPRDLRVSDDVAELVTRAITPLHALLEAVETLLILEVHGKEMQHG